MKMMRGTNLMQQLWFIIINNQQAHNTTNNTEWNQPLMPSYLLQCLTPYAVVHNLHSWRWTYRCPKHVELFMIINHNCCIKLVPLVIFIYDARSHINQTQSNVWYTTALSNINKKSSYTRSDQVHKHLLESELHNTDHTDVHLKQNTINTNQPMMKLM